MRPSASVWTVALARAGRKPERKAEVVYAQLCTSNGVRNMGEGVAWIVDYLTEHRDRWAQIVIDGKSGAGDLVDRLRIAGFSPKVIWTPTTDQVISAHAMMDAAIRDRTLSHPDDAELEAEAAVISRRKIGAAGGPLPPRTRFGWTAPEGMTSAGMDALTLAHWAAKTTKRRPRELAVSRVGVVM